MKKLYKVLFMLVFLVSSTFVDGQINSIPQKKGLKVGVVLSGGGAKGTAHVGVLRMIEQAGIKIDYIGGASMGAIVAGLYSVGYSVDELDSIIRVMDMSKMVSGKLPRKYQTFFKKEFDSNTSLKLPIIDWSIGLPQGLSTGQAVIDEFNYLTRGYHGYQDFNKLKVPLVIMTTDIVTGESVANHEGNLPLIMRASSSFPSLFAPVEIDDRLFVDGGVANNFPVQEVIDMGADVIIGVSVEDGLYKRKDLTSINSIIEQITSFKMVEKSEKQKKLVNIYIKPDIAGYSVMSFDKAVEIIELGEIEGFKHYNEFLEVSDLQGVDKEINKGVDLPEAYTIVDVEVFGSKYYSEKYFFSRFNIDELPKTITTQDITNGLKSLTGTENFDMVSYQLLKDSTNYKLVFNIVEKENIGYLKVGLNFNNLYGAGALLNFSIRNKYIKSSRFMAEVVVSNKPRFNIMLFKDNSVWPGFLFQTKYMQYNVAMPTSAIGGGESSFQGSYIDMNYRDWTSRFMAQKTLNEDFFIAIGAEYKSLYFSTYSLKVQDDQGNVTDKAFILDDSSYLNAVLEISADTKDNKYFPKSGIYFESGVKVVLPVSVYTDGVDAGFNNNVVSSFADVKIDYSLPLTDVFSWTNVVSSSLVIGKVPSLGLSYIFGGYNKSFLNNVHGMYGYKLYGILETIDDGFFKYHTSMQMQVMPSLYVTAHANYLLVSSLSGKWYEFKSINYTGYALSVGYDSLLGPVEFTGDYSPDTGAFGVMFNLGYWF